MVKKENLPHCPVATTLSLLNSKWKVLIIRNLRLRPWNFNELKRDLEGISQKVLTESLRSLEEDGLVNKETTLDNPPKSVYSLSELGKKLDPVISAMESFGNFYKSL